ncbi:sugar phosphate isomerase/epimerase family protein [Methanimicrococcus blatticola]|uniref:sugar phosphate isomerase/epimerase family protein n=1 Tax=Methanimicrococcus blatticola TaxID=91560 RepID=UPI0014151EF5|nr:sugar phosphate isomerase/epimerase family protein [Methanimicrococcus blatticola]MBZ3935302.1 sugar phosphate isomerase/epimerase [Methanimicrococcus blatticola]MCC2508600.1 sugar phosphate isomerase/epimerase [Methanimicrococcus blatticola]
MDYLFIIDFKFIFMIGISTLAYSNKSLTFALSEIEKSAKHAEIFSEGIHNVIHPDVIHPGTIRPDSENSSEILSSFSLSYSIHAPTLDINLAAVREKIRKAGVEIINESAVFCMNNNIEILVVHPGYAADVQTLPAAYKSFEKSTAELEKIKEETGVRICIENMPNAEIYLFKTPEDEKKINLKSKNLEFILDIGHANTAGNLNEFLEKEIAHYHIHDNAGDVDNHLGFGNGTIGFNILEQIVKKAKKDKAVLIAENKTVEEALKTVEMLKKAGAE